MDFFAIFSVIFEKIEPILDKHNEIASAAFFNRVSTAEEK